MKKSEIKIGETYTAKVSGRIVSVRITGTRQVGERTRWSAVNLQTGRAITIKSAQRLRRTVAQRMIERDNIRAGLAYEDANYPT